MQWLSLRSLITEPHRWPGGRTSYLYSYERNAAEVADAKQPGDVVQAKSVSCQYARGGYRCREVADIKQPGDVVCSMVQVGALVEVLQTTGSYVGTVAVVTARW